MFKTIEEIDSYLLEEREKMIQEMDPNEDGYEDPLPLEEMSPREKLLAVYHSEVGNEAEFAIYDAIEFFKNYDGDILTSDEKKKILKSLDKAYDVLGIPFYLNL